MSAFSPARWLVPRSVEEAAKMMKEEGEQTLIYAGGTYVHELRERGELGWAKAVVDLQAIGLSDIKVTSKEVRIGATTTLNGAISSKALQEKGFETLIQAAYAMGPEQIKNAATVGGAVACGIAVIDLVAALVSLEAKAVVVDSAGAAQEVPILELTGNGAKTSLGKQKLVTEVVLPRPSSGSGSGFRKFRRSAADWPIMNASASIKMENRHCAAVTLAFGSRPEGYFRLAKSEASLVGKVVEERALGEMIEAIAGEARFVDHFTASAAYKSGLVKALVRDAVLRAAEAASS